MTDRNCLYLHGYYQADTWDLILSLSQARGGVLSLPRSPNQPCLVFVNGVPNGLASILNLAQLPYGWAHHAPSLNPHLPSWAVRQGAQILAQTSLPLAALPTAQHHPLWPGLLTGPFGPISSSHHAFALASGSLPFES
jgi:hypothetical protein